MPIRVYGKSSCPFRFSPAGSTKDGSIFSPPSTSPTFKLQSSPAFGRSPVSNAIQHVQEGRKAGRLIRLSGAVSEALSCSLISIEDRAKDQSAKKIQKRGLLLPEEKPGQLDKTATTSNEQSNGNSKELGDEDQILERQGRRRDILSTENIHGTKDAKNPSSLNGKILKQKKSIDLLKTQHQEPSTSIFRATYGAKKKRKDATSALGFLSSSLTLTLFQDHNKKMKKERLHIPLGGKLRSSAKTVAETPTKNYHCAEVSHQGGLEMKKTLKGDERSLKQPLKRKEAGHADCSSDAICARAGYLEKMKRHFAELDGAAVPAVRLTGAPHEAYEPSRHARARRRCRRPGSPGLAARRRRAYAEYRRAISSVSSPITFEDFSNNFFDFASASNGEEGAVYEGLLDF